MSKLYSTKKDKGPGSKVVTFNIVSLREMLSRDPEAFVLAWSKMRRDMDIWGLKARLDYENTVLVNAALDADANGTWTSRFQDSSPSLSRIRSFFECGVMEDASVRFEDAFEAACGFYQMLDLQMTLTKELDVDSPIPPKKTV